MLHASETWPLTKPNLQHLQRNDRAMIRQICNVRPQDIVTTTSNELLVRLGIEDLDLHSEGEKTPMVWTCGMLQWCSRQPLTYRLMESVGLGGTKWHGSSWQRGIAESGSSRLSTLMIDVPGDLVWDLPWVQQASYLEGGPLMWMLPLYLHVNHKSDYDMIYVTITVNAYFFKTGKFQNSFLRHLEAQTNKIYDVASNTNQSTEGAVRKEWKLQR